jgi:hypothetical protein
MQHEVPNSHEHHHVVLCGFLKDNTCEREVKRRVRAYARRFPPATRASPGATSEYILLHAFCAKAFYCDDEYEKVKKSGNLGNPHAPDWFWPHVSEERKAQCLDDPARVKEAKDYIDEYIAEIDNYAELERRGQKMTLRIAPTAAFSTGSGSQRAPATNEGRPRERVPMTTVDRREGSREAPATAASLATRQIGTVATILQRGELVVAKALEARMKKEHKKTVRFAT